MKEALFYNKLDNLQVECILCPHNCLIADGKAGRCGARLNTSGSLASLVYGQVSCEAVDPIEKKPLFHFYPGSLVYSLGTLGCNMRCSHCQNWQISRARIGEEETVRTTTYLSPQDTVKNALNSDCEGIAFTYNEPTVWFEYTLDVSKLAKENGLYTVYVTNGYINSEPLDLIAPYLDAYRVDIKGFGDEFYREIAGVPSIKPVLESAVRAKKKWGMHVEAVTNIIPGKNDAPQQLHALARWIAKELGEDVPWHITRFMPCLELSGLSSTPEYALKTAQEIGFQEGLQYVYIGNVPFHPGANTYCPSCGEMIIERGAHSLVRYELSTGACRFCGKPVSVREQGPSLKGL